MDSEDFVYLYSNNSLPKWWNWFNGKIAVDPRCFKKHLLHSECLLCVFACPHLSVSLKGMLQPCTYMCINSLRSYTKSKKKSICFKMRRGLSGWNYSADVKLWALFQGTVVSSQGLVTSPSVWWKKVKQNPPFSHRCSSKMNLEHL